MRLGLGLVDDDVAAGIGIFEVALMVPIAMGKLEVGEHELAEYEEYIREKNK